MMRFDLLSVEINHLFGFNVFFFKNVERGEKCAQFNLGDMYSSVYKEYKEAEKWYRKAAIQNDIDAERRLIEIAELRARNLIKE